MSTDKIKSVIPYQPKFSRLFERFDPDCPRFEKCLESPNFQLNKIEKSALINRFEKVANENLSIFKHQNPFLLFLFDLEMSSDILTYRMRIFTPIHDESNCTCNPMPSSSASSFQPFQKSSDVQQSAHQMSRIVHRSLNIKRF